jgi:hypothetical protein
LSDRYAMQAVSGLQVGDLTRWREWSVEVLEVPDARNSAAEVLIQLLDQRQVALWVPAAELAGSEVWRWAGQLTFAPVRRVVGRPQRG